MAVKSSMPVVFLSNRGMAAKVNRGMAAKVSKATSEGKLRKIGP